MNFRFTSQSSGTSTWKSGGHPHAAPEFHDQVTGLSSEWRVRCWAEETRAALRVAIYLTVSPELIIPPDSCAPCSHSSGSGQHEALPTNDRKG